MSVTAGDPHRIFIRPTGEVHDYWRTEGCADSVPAQSQR